MFKYLDASGLVFGLFFRLFFMIKSGCDRVAQQLVDPTFENICPTLLIRLQIWHDMHGKLAGKNVVDGVLISRLHYLSYDIFRLCQLHFYSVNDSFS